MTLNTQLLAMVLDELIPSRPDGLLPGAGTLGVGAVVEHAAAGTPELGQMLTQGLAALDDIARRTGAEGFGALSPTARVATTTGRRAGSSDGTTCAGRASTSTSGVPRR